MRGIGGHRLGRTGTAGALAALALLLQVSAHALPVLPGHPIAQEFDPALTGGESSSRRLASDEGGDVDPSPITGNPVQPGQTVAGGFRLDPGPDVDLTPAAAPASPRARVRLRWRSLPSDARAPAVRVGSLRAPRLDAAQASQARAVYQLRAGPRATRFLRRSAPTVRLPLHHGLTADDDSLVWAVTDRRGGLFAVAGLLSDVPESASLALAGGGLATLLVLALRRRRPGAPE